MQITVIPNGKSANTAVLSVAVCQRLRQAGAEVTADFTSYDYGHEWAMWDLSVRAFLDWLPRSDAFAPEK